MIPNINKYKLWSLQGKMHCKLVPLHPFERSLAQTAQSLHAL